MHQQSMAVIDDTTATTARTGRRTAKVLLDIEDAAKRYRRSDGSESTALLPVSAKLKQGEFISLLGPSGCGKTTLLKMCAGLIRQSSGRITFGNTGKPVQPGSYGFVFQAPALLPWRTVLSNVMLPADILGLDKDTARRRAESLLDLVRLSHAGEKRPSELSGGMQQRASIARALLHDPQLLFMDEPFGALDAMTREELNLELQRIHLDQGKTVLFVTHDIEEAVLLSDRILVMSSGPGRLVGDVEVSLPRPRRIADKKNPAFYETVEYLRGMLDRHEPLPAA
jgi:NitT/TauT family transport system ATP-binding protein